MPDASSGEIHTRTHAHIRGSLSFSLPLQISPFPTYDYLTSFRDRYSPLYGTAETINREIEQTGLDPSILFEFCTICSISSSITLEGFPWNFSYSFDLNFEFSWNFFVFDRLEIFSNCISNFFEHVFLFDLRIFISSVEIDNFDRYLLPFASISFQIFHFFGFLGLFSDQSRHPFVVIIEEKLRIQKPIVSPSQSHSSSYFAPAREKFSTWCFKQWR